VLGLRGDMEGSKDRRRAGRLMLGGGDVPSLSNLSSAILCAVALIRASLLVVTLIRALDTDRVL
jgi:hypothetical protein